MSDLDTFRKEVAAWLEANCPAEMRGAVQGEDDICWAGRKWVFQSDAQRIWLQRMVEKGWTVPDWPREYGGGGLSHEEVKILQHEMAVLGCRAPLTSFGIMMLGPALMKYGSEEQKREHLPKIASGEIRWCQGYSEPGAGSDLASLQTKAEDRGDQFLVTGSKIWTSYADEADWIFCLVRTDPNAPKHAGISFVLFDMDSPGVSTKRIALISGKSPFCETFFEDVPVPKKNLVGKLNQGWEIAKYLLTFERQSIGSQSGSGREDARSLGRIAYDSLGIEGGILADTVLRSRIASFEIDVWAFRLAVERIRDLANNGQAHPALSSVLKYCGAEINKRRLELAVAVSGSDALEWEGPRSRDGHLARAWLRSKGNSIEGGTNEVQLNVIAKRLLNLPGA
ncbi:MAG: acyl-CoA dehydrogenase family protein [Candidatus Binataceae bacterium]